FTDKSLGCEAAMAAQCSQAHRRLTFHRHPMTALTKEWPEARHALLACLCFVASLLLGLAGTADAAYGSAPAAGIVVQQVSHGSLMLPHQSCPARAQAQGSGTCTSVSVVGLSPPASGY